MGDPQLRVGRIDFANCTPLFRALTEDGEAPVAYVPGLPTELNCKLRDGVVDLSPSSSVEYLHSPDCYGFLPDLMATMARSSRVKGVRPSTARMAIVTSGRRPGRIGPARRNTRSKVATSLPHNGCVRRMPSILSQPNPIPLGRLAQSRRQSTNWR